MALMTATRKNDYTFNKQITLTNKDTEEMAYQLLLSFDYYDTVAFCFIAEAVWNAFIYGYLTHWDGSIEDLHRIIKSNYI